MTSTYSDRLPAIDVHTTTVHADRTDAWQALLHVAERMFAIPGAPQYARLVRCADTGDSGPRPLAVGSTIPGFHVAEAVTGRRLTLLGRHAFSDYSLVFTLDDAPDGAVRLSAATRAAFPGPTGALYRLAVIGTGGHRIVVSGILRTVRRRAERAPSTGRG